MPKHTQARGIDMAHPVGFNAAIPLQCHINLEPLMKCHGNICIPLHLPFLDKRPDINLMNEAAPVLGMQVPIRVCNSFWLDLRVRSCALPTSKLSASFLQIHHTSTSRVLTATPSSLGYQ